MKHLKTLGLAASALSLVAVLGVGSAAADEICTSAGCSGNSTITTLEWTTSGTWGISTTGGTTLVTCAAREEHTTVTNQGLGVDPIELKWEGLSYTECTSDVVVLAEGSGRGSASGSNGTLSATGTEVTVNGIFGASCVYGSGASLDWGTTSGTSLTVNAVVPRISGGFTCPADTVWKGTMNVTNHSSVFWVNN